jgi:glycosyltransferase involved in cell wall biosynthesis
MTTTYFLLPSTSPRLAGGGQLAAIRMVECLKPDFDVAIATYSECCAGFDFLPDLMANAESNDARFVVLWGYDVPLLSALLRGRPWFYWAHSVGYDFDIPHGIPIVGVSAHSLAYWADRGVHPLDVLPNVLPDEFEYSENPRDIDVLAFQRKSGPELLAVCAQLAETSIKVHVVRTWEPSVAKLYQRSTVFLYDARAHWRRASVSEGFGLHIIEALASGCHVRVAPTAAAVELLAPGENWSQFGLSDPATEAASIITILRTTHLAPSHCAERFRPPQIRAQWAQVTSRFW